MKKIIYVIILLYSITGFSQEPMLYDEDPNISLLIPEDSEEGETKDQTFIRGSIGEDVFIFSKSNKDFEKLAANENEEMPKFYKGMKDGMIKATKGKIIKDVMVKIDDHEVVNFVYSIQVEGQTKVVDNYFFFYKKFAYSIQFLSPEKESEDFKKTKDQILQSIKFK